MELRYFDSTRLGSYIALCTDNLADPLIALPGENFNTILWSGDGTAASRDFTGVGFQPDLVWEKVRTDTWQYNLTDSVRGVGRALMSDSNDDEDVNSAQGYIDSFDSDGFSTVAGSSNNAWFNPNSQTIVAWNWKATGGAAVSKTYAVTVAASKLVIGGFSQVTVEMREGSTYTFDTSDSSVSGHTFKFATAADAAGSTEYTTGVTETGTPGNAGAKTVIVVAGSAPQLYYYCSNHSSMGGTANTNTTAGSSNFDGNNPTIVSANVEAGFSIVRYYGTGDTSGTTMGHGLSEAPELVIVKRLDVNGYSWAAGSDSMQSDPTAWTKLMFLDTATAPTTEINIWRNVAPTASVFECGNSGVVNAGSGGEYIAYCWHSVPGFSQVGGYEGNANLNGTFVYTGFKPAFIMTKSIDSTSPWQMFDDKRIGINPRNSELQAQSAAADNTTTDFIDLVSNGFKNRDTTDPNVAESYLYIAFAATPFKTATAR